MDNLVLTAVILELGRGLRDGILADLRQEAADRFRLRWALGDRVKSTLVSMRPELPWIGRPAERAAGKALAPGRFAAALRRAFVGKRLLSVEKPTSDRWVELRFADEARMVLELALHGANIVHVDARGNVVSSLRRPRSAEARLAPGAAYAPPSPPGGLLDPFERGAEVDGLLAALASDGEPWFEGLRRHVFGVGSPAARLICDEAIATGRTPGSVLADRLEQLSEGRLAPVIEAADLWPWQPDREPREGCSWQRGPDAAATAGLWHEARDRERQAASRRRSLRQAVRRESSRLGQAIRRCEADVRGFEDPDRFRRWAEALLAGLTRAERVGDAVRVPDPTDPEAGDLLIPAKPELPLPRVAEALFDRHRRAKRGRIRARQRLEQLEARAASLSELERAFDDGREVEDLLVEIRRLRLPLALEPDTRAGRAASRRAVPRIEGVRVYHASTGDVILAGKGGRANHRLTFKLSAPHDYWFHAQGVSGAHVVLRNERRDARPGAALEEAASVAAYHSQASGEAFVDVQWTQRKNVKKPRGAAPGTVVLKRFETVRVPPRLPAESA